MAKEKLIDSTNKLVTCVGYRNEYMTEVSPTKDCRRVSCYFLEAHQGKHWTQDTVECWCPVDIMPGDKLRVRKRYTVQPVRAYNRKAV